MANINDTSYPFDPTGSRTSNLVPDDQQIVSNPNFRDYFFLVPRWAPYFGDSLVVTFWDLQGNTRVLTKNVDYYMTHWFISASRACAADVFGSISLLNKQLTGRVSLKYQTVGGDWVQSEADIAEILANKIQNPRITTWEQVVNIPYSFPVIDHEWDEADLIGMKDVHATLESILAAIAAQGAGGLAAHLADTNNPHHVTKAQVGLDKVRNLPTTDLPTALAGNSDDYYVTPYSLSYVLNQKVGSPFQNHVLDHNNPHQVSAHQTGAYTQAEVDALLDNKVDADGTAANTVRFAGMISTEFRDWVLQETAANSLKFDGKTALEYQAQVLTGTAANASKVFGFDQGQLYSQLDARYGVAGGTGLQKFFSFYDPGSVTPAPANLWMQLGTITFTDASSSFTLDNDISWLVSGVGATATASTSLWLRFSGRDVAPNYVNGEVVNLGLNTPNSTLGYVVAADKKSAAIYIKTPNAKQTITVTEMNRGMGSIGDGSNTLVAEPAGIIYLSTDRYARASEVATAAQMATLMQQLASSFNSITTALT